MQSPPDLRTRKEAPRRINASVSKQVLLTACENGTVSQFPSQRNRRRRSHKPAEAPPTKTTAAATMTTYRLRFIGSPLKVQLQAEMKSRPRHVQLQGSQRWLAVIDLDQALFRSAFSVLNAGWSPAPI